MNAQFFSDQTLQQSVLQFNNAKTENDYDMLFSKFSAAKTSEKWQANYYAAAALYLKTNFLLKNSPNSPLGEPNESARKLAMQALASEKNNGEVNLLLALIHFQKIRIKTAADPQKELRTVTSFMNKAETLKNNPRLSFLKAEIAEKQGNKTEAIKLYQKAAKEFETSDASSSSPSWGKQLIGTN
jgi:tetratricopeptide (TPR) repeat protein